MKILHYVDEKNLSWWRPWLQLIDYLQKCGLENHIVCRDGGTLIEEIKNYNLDFSTYKPAVSTIPEICFGIKAIFKDVNPDIIHTRLSSSAAIAGYWGEKLSIPVVSTIDKFPKGKYYRRATKIFPCSTAIAEHMIKEDFLRHDMEIIYNPLDYKKYRRDNQIRKAIRLENDIKENCFVFLAAGRFVDWKGFDDLLEACLLMARDKEVKSNWKLWLAGNGPEKNKLESYIIANQELQEKVKFLGFVEDVRPFMWASDTFVLPSLTEPFGLVLLEAMASGLPVIASDTGGPLDIVNKESGYLFKTGNSVDLKENMVKMLQNVDLNGYSAGAMQTAEKFSVEEIGQQTIKIYQGIQNVN